VKKDRFQRINLIQWQIPLFFVYRSGNYSNWTFGSP